MAKNSPWFVWLTKAGAALGDRLKVEAGYKGRDGLVRDALELLVSVRTGKGMPAFIEDVKRRRLEILAEREKCNAEARQVGRSGEGAEIRRGADGDT